MAGFGNKIAHSMDRHGRTSIFYTLENCITIWVNVHTKTHRLGIFQLTIVLHRTSSSR